MQLGGIGSNHSSDMHQVTRCLHDHNQLDKGGAKLTMAPSTAAQQTLQADQGQQAQFTFTDWLQRLLRSGKERLLGFWNGSESPSSGDRSEKTGSDQMIAQLNSGNDKGVTNNSHAEKETAIYNNPYFATVPAEQPQNAVVAFVKKIKLKTSNIAGQLAKHLPGKFSEFQKKGSFHAKKEGNREDLRKRSKYREDKLEIDCVLTDESYLMDSYDRKGEYRQLTTTK